jgi:hypothetical protein
MKTLAYICAPALLAFLLPACDAGSLHGRRISKVPDVNDVKAGFVKRMESLKNVMVVYDVNDALDDEVTARAAALLKEELKHTSGGVVTVEGARSRRRFCRLDGMFSYESKTNARPATLSPVAGNVYSVNDASSGLTIVAGGLTQALIGYDSDTRFEGLITKWTPQEPYAIDEPWGLRWTNIFLTEGLPARCKVTVLEDGKAELQFAGAGGWYDRWVLDPEKGYAPVMEESLGKDDCVMVRTLMSDWRQVDSAWVAYKIERVAFICEPNVAHVPCDRAVYTVESCVVDSKGNTPSLYKMVWPKGTELIDRGGFYTVGEDRTSAADANTGGSRP